MSGIGEDIDIERWYICDSQHEYLLHAYIHDSSYTFELDRPKKTLIITVSLISNRSQTMPERHCAGVFV